MSQPPRIPPLADAEMNAAQRELLEPFRQDGRVDNVFRTLARHPDLMKRWLPFARHVLSKSTLGPREREIVILRAGYLCRAEYEWAQHVLLGKRRGLSESDIAAIVAGRGISPKEDFLLTAADELHKEARISDTTWKALSAHYSREQLIDIIFTFAQYTLVSMFLNSAGVEVDDYLKGGYPKLPD
ncbi:MAG TPA: carboxymuconolactone decarboxylase family protein [Rhizomicrobium sp.]|jgi:alkylhydroperoxidase family enzyme